MLKLTVEQQRRGLTDAALSRLTGIHPADISKFKRGLVPVYPGWRRAIAKVLGMEEADLFQEVDGDGPSA